MKESREITAIKIKQWLNDWNNVPFGTKRKKPEPHFYMFSINANMLKKLSKVYPRKADELRDIELGVQRKHDPERSEKIRQYVFGGFPWSDLPEAKRTSEEFSSLKMPGWLPTAIIANIITTGTKRGGLVIDSTDVIAVRAKENGAILTLPEGAFEEEWSPKIPPLEIIDGQHRLWAFNNDENLDGDFELPVVAFHNLDVSWQAYLFYTINIKPKKINASLAFDLYPILRVQEWLEKSPDGAFVYKETRAQELVEVLWSFDSSPWKNRINMLGERVDQNNNPIVQTITQAAFIRSLIATFIKTSNTKRLGGLFGSPLSDGNLLYWNRTQQAAFLIYAWKCISVAIADCKEEWAISIRNSHIAPKNEPKSGSVQKMDPAYSSKMSLISTDQGVRGFLHIINDMVYINSADLKLNEIPSPDEIKEDRIDFSDVTNAIKIFEESNTLRLYIEHICLILTKFDWRTSSMPELDRAQKQKQMIFKGSSGYKEIRSELLRTLVESTKPEISEKASLVLKDLGYGN